MEAADELYSISALAAKFDLARQTVRKRLDEAGVVPQQESTRGGKQFRLGDVAHLMRSEYAARTDGKAQAQERKLQAEAREKEIKVERLEGTLIEISEVERAMIDIFRTLYQRIVVQLPAIHANDIVKLRTRGEVEAKLKKELGDIFQEVRSNPNNLLTKGGANDA